VREHPGRVTQQEAQAVQIVDAVIHDLVRRLGQQPGPALPGRAHVHGDARGKGLPEPAPVQQRLDGAHARIPAHLLVDGQLHAGGAGCLHHLHGLVIAFGQWLLAEQVLAGGGHLHGDLRLLGGGNGHIYDADGAVFQHFLQGAVDPGQFEGPGCRLGSLGANVEDTGQAQPRPPVDRQVAGIDDGAGADAGDTVVAGIGRQCR